MTDITYIKSTSQQLLGNCLPLRKQALIATGPRNHHLDGPNVSHALILNPDHLSGTNHKKTHRIYCEEGLQVRKRKSKRRTAIGCQPMVILDGVNERRSMDFLRDQLSNGRRIRVLNVMDDYSRQCLASVVDTSINGVRVTRELDRLITWHGKPSGIVCDNGAEFTLMAMFDWSKRTGIDLHFFRPGKPNENAFIESFNGRQQVECMNENLFSTLSEAREIIEKWRQHYTQTRPHSALNWLTPNEFVVKESNEMDKAA